MMYTCASCEIGACAKEGGARELEKLPKNCPMRGQALFDEAFCAYGQAENHDFYVKCSEIEGMGYGRWTRLEETMRFCREMGFHRLGLAFCRGLRREARVIDRLLRGHGFEVESVICKTGGIPKEAAGIPRAQKIHPDAFEAMCNPIAQAKLLNTQKTELNILVGLCVGHDALFCKYSEALVTTLIAKDRVLAHNPVGAVYQADGYYREKLHAPL